MEEKIIMPYIYLITNDVNGKQYVGKTTHNSIEERWKEHLKDYKRERCEKRPLYVAMKKYGIEHFHIEELEQVAWENNLEEREIYWINKYNTFHKGYNATYGGEGKRYLDYQLIIDTYNKCQSLINTAKQLNISEDSVHKVLLTTNTCTQEEIIKNSIKNLPKRKVAQYDKNTGELLNIFESNAEAERQFPTGRHITDACQGRRKTAGGYIWKYVEE